MAITEEAKTAHRERVAALRERFGEPNTAFDQAVREMFPAKSDLLEFMRDHETGGDREAIHKMLDDMLVGYIDDMDIYEAFSRMKLWYS